MSRVRLAVLLAAGVLSGAIEPPAGGIGGTGSAAASSSRARGRRGKRASKKGPGAWKQPKRRRGRQGRLGRGATARYYDLTVKHGLTEHVSVMTHDPQKIHEFFRPLERGLAVVDVGSGPGDVAEVLARDYGHRVTGIDISRKMVGAFRARGIPGSRAEVGDARRVPVKRHSADIALSSFVLLHLDRKGGLKALRELRRIVKRGGRALIGTNVVPRGKGVSFREAHSEMRGLADDPYFYFWNQKDLLRAIRRAGFKVADEDVVTEQRWAPWFSQMYVSAVAR